MDDIHDVTATQPVEVDRQGFARAFGRIMRAGDGPRRTRKGLVFAVVVTVVIFSGGAVLAGVVTSKGTVSAAGGARAAANTSLASPSPSVLNDRTAGTPRTGAYPAAGVGLAAPAAPGGSAAQPWKTAGPPPMPTGGPMGVAPSTAASPTWSSQSAAAGGSATSGNDASQPASTPPSTSAPQAQVQAQPPSSASTGIEVTGQVNCTSGHPVEGFWIEAVNNNKQSGWASWKYATGTNADYWYWLPTTQPYKMSVGCGGSRATWAVATYAPQVSGQHNSFNCYDVKGQAHYGTCVLR
jgi:hypothetical protein